MAGPPLPLRKIPGAFLRGAASQGRRASSIERPAASSGRRHRASQGRRASSIERPAASSQPGHRASQGIEPARASSQPGPASIEHRASQGRRASSIERPGRRASSIERPGPAGLDAGGIAGRPAGGSAFLRNPIASISGRAAKNRPALAIERRPATRN